MSITAPRELAVKRMAPAVAGGCSISTEPIGAKDSPQESRKPQSRLIGALFLLGFLSYGGGFALVSSVIGRPDFLSAVPAHRTTLILGAFLMLLNSVVDAAKGVLFFPILDKHSRRTALTYLATMIAEVVLLALGVLCLLMIVPLAKEGADAGPAGAGWAKALGSLAVQSNTTAYQIAEMMLGFGCVFLCALLFRTRLIPRFVAMWGVFGYAILMTGSVAEIFGIHIGLICTIPGGLFELVLAFWLLSKGFDPKAYNETRGSRTAVTTSGS